MEYLPTTCIKNEDEEFEKVLPVQNPSSLPCIAEFNNNRPSKANQFQVHDSVNEIDKTNGIGSIR